MRPEAPTPFPIPEIIHDRDNPPVFMDLEIHPPALVNLLTALKGDQTYELDKIFITEGLLTATLDKSGTAFETEIHTLRNKTPEEAIRMWFDQCEAGRQPVRGGYNVLAEVHIFPDTILLDHIFHIVKTEKGTIPGRRIEPIRHIQILTYSLSAECSYTLLHELEHSFQRQLMMYPPSSIPKDMLHQILEQWAASKRLDQQLARLACRAVTVKPLISDQQILELYDIASDRYHLLYSRNDSGIQE